MEGESNPEISIKARQFWFIDDAQLLQQLAYQDQNFAVQAILAVQYGFTCLQVQYNAA